MKMKRFVLAVLSVIALCSILSLPAVARAYNAAYTHTLFQSSNAPPTIDGTYIVDNDWIASGKEEFGDGAAFHDQWIMDPNIYCCIVEVTDNTTDTEDKLTICFDGTESGTSTPPDGGPNPTQYDKKLEVTGHGGSATVQWFVGDGSGWVAATASGDLLDLAQSLTTTPTIEADHYVFEMNIDFHGDTSLGSPLVGYEWGQFVSYYDEDTGETQQWPPADATPAGSPDVPDSWGGIQYVEEANSPPTIPEPLTVAAIVFLSTFAVAVSFYFLRKRPKTQTQTSGKTREISSTL
jgi:hypothetical protein